MRVLVISNNAISEYNNNGKTISSFIRNIALENIAQLYFGSNELPSIKNCHNYYRITEFDIFKSIISLKFKTKNTHARLMSQIDTHINTKKKDSDFVKFLKKNASTLAVLREFLWKCGTWDTKELNDWIKKFNPDVIFAVLGGSIFTHNISITIAKRYNVPLNVYFTDDYILGDTASNIFQKLHQKKLKKVYKDTLSIAKKAFVIGDKMQEAYRQYYHRDFGILVNGINLEQFDEFKPVKLDLSKPILISYIGGLHLNRWQSIIHLAHILSTQNKYCIQYRVFSVSCPDEYILKEFSKAGVSYCGSLDYAGVIEQMKISHFLLHVESFNSRNRIYTKYSISTKIPEYMASKRGVIAYGPSDIASIELFENNNIGCTITENDTDDNICDKINDFIEHDNPYDFDKQYKYVVDHFDQNKMQLDKILI